jgi:S1-C subfamily serine protease
MFVSKEGEILTAAHFLRAANQDMKVRLPDGKTIPARSLGVSRELDLGLVKISEAGKWPAAVVTGRKEVDSSAAYVALLFPGNAAGDPQPQMKIAGLRRFFRTTLWTDVDAETFTPGGVLLNPQGQAVGLHTGRSQFGGFLFTRLHAGELQPHLERMRRGEVFGAWPAGSEPLLGLEGQAGNQGLEVVSLIENGPAATAGIQRGDVVTSIGGKPIVALQDVSSAISEMDPGAQVAVELLRGGEKVSAGVTLAPRLP